MGEQYYDKKDCGCNIFITIICNKDDKYPCFKHEEKKPYKDDCKKIDWRKYEEKKKMPAYEKDGMKWPGFAGGYAPEEYEAEYEA